MQTQITLRASERQAAKQKQARRTQTDRVFAETVLECSRAYLAARRNGAGHGTLLTLDIDESNARRAYRQAFNLGS